ncbi:hypothetical protein [Mycobacteroides abscessus]|uniref:hypothetical protein n=1 Tax=Mycobacteroides abscessus TaxID=36809 RepID=UPI0006975D26|nr:hypothetical protein [Mycobacteroides abscessus]
MNWTQIIDWGTRHAAVVSLGGILTVIMSAYAGHLLTKMRDNLKRLRDRDSTWRKLMLDKCVDLLAVTAEVKVWVHVSREKQAHLAESGPYTEVEQEAATAKGLTGAYSAAAQELQRKIDLELISLLFRVQNIGEIARDFCPTETSTYATELTQSVVQFLLSAKDDESVASVAAAETDVDEGVRKMHRLIRTTYLTEMYDSLDPRRFRNRLRYGFTENRRREYRGRAAVKIIAEMEKSEGNGS